MDFGATFSGLSQTNAINLALQILNTNPGGTSPGGNGDVKFLLCAELNVAAYSALGAGFFTPTGASTATSINALLTT
ncbi:MAG TPA: hypothetical protein VFZ25_14930, partial [Chloroflexota bacterium]|nr:hypothetical protein [Chloroflexota bacterium]